MFINRALVPVDVHIPSLSTDIAAEYLNAKAHHPLNDDLSRSIAFSAIQQCVDLELGAADALREIKVS